MDKWWKSSLTGPVINFLGEIKERKHFNQPPILIGGCGRSGTTLLLSILSAHPRIHALPIETDAFTSWTKDGKPKRRDRFYRRLLLDRIKPSAVRWCEKRPYNVRYIREILNFFNSKAKFIHIVRDPRAVCTSFHPTKMEEYWIPIERYVYDVEKGLEFINDPRVLTLRYEDLIEQNEVEIQRVLDFLDEAYCEEMKHWLEHATVRTNVAWSEGLKPLNKESLNKWQVKAHERMVKEVIANSRVQAIMKSFNYQ